MTAIEETLKRSVRQWNESGELSRLHGQPLDLSDDSPEWFVNRLLNKEGFSHPTIEAGRDVEDLSDEADRTRERLRAHCSCRTRRGNRRKSSRLAGV